MIYKDLVIVPFHDYKKWLNEGFRTRDAHIFEHIQKKTDKKILVINRPVSLAEFLFKRQDWKTKIGTTIFKGNSWQIKEIYNNVFVLDIFIWDFFRPLLEKKRWWNTCFTYQKTNDIIQNAISSLHFENEVFILQNPMSIGIIRKMKVNNFIFDAIDNWAFHPQMKKISNIVREYYDYIDKNAKAITTVSESLLSVFPNNKNKYWIPNGVDIEFFQTNGINNKNDFFNIGYVGKIQDRIDFDLVEECLRYFNYCNFFFYGPIYGEHQRIIELKNKYKNVFFKGDIHYSKLPLIMQTFSVAIMPHKINSFTESMNPLKIYEYLAAGKPVVTTDVAGVQNISDAVFISVNNNHFITLINNAFSVIKNTDNYSKIVSSSINHIHSWEYKTNQLLEIVEKI